jgi:hypothetical protein
MYGVIFQSLTSIGVALGISAYFLPRLTAYSALLVPIVLLTGMLEGWLGKVQERRASRALDQLSKLLIDVFHNKYAVATCQLETYFIDKYEKLLRRSGK